MPRIGIIVPGLYPSDCILYPVLRSWGQYILVSCTLNKQNIYYSIQYLFRYNRCKYVFFVWTQYFIDVFQFDSLTRTCLPLMKRDILRM